MPKTITYIFKIVRTNFLQEMTITRKLITTSEHLKSFEVDSSRHAAVRTS